MKKMSEIQEEEDEENLCITNTEVQRERIRKIIQKQRSLYSSISSSSSNNVGSCSSLSPSRKSCSLQELMEGRNKSLRELLKMEHTSSEAYFKGLSGLPMVKPMGIRGSHTDGGIHRQKIIKPTKTIRGIGFDGLSRITSGSSFTERGSVSSKRSTGNRKLRRIKSYRTLPELGIQRLKGFTFRFRLRPRLRILICGRKL